MEWKELRKEVTREELDFGDVSSEEDGVNPGGQISRIGCCCCCCWYIETLMKSTSFCRKGRGGGGGGGGEGRGECRRDILTNKDEDDFMCLP